MKRTLVIVFSVLFLLTACNNSTTGNADKTYTVATDVNFKPFEFKDPETGEMKGFDIDLIRAIAEEAGFEVEFETMQFDGILTGLKAGRFPIGIAGISITEERKKSIDFSDPYYDSGLILMVHKDNTEIRSIADVDGKTVGTRQGSTSHDYLREHTEAEIEAFPGIVNAYLDVKNKRLDAALYDLPNVKYSIAQNGDGKLKTVGDVLQGQSYGIAFPKGSELVDDVNQALKTLKENGTYDELYKKYFGTKPPVK